MGRLLRIIQKEMLTQLRNKSGLVIMTVFPIVLILVLGFSLKNMFERPDGPTVLHGTYTLESAADGTVNDGFPVWFRETVVKESEKIGFTLVEIPETEGRSQVEKRASDCWISVGPKILTVVTNENNAMNGEITEMILKSMTASYNAVSAIAAERPEALPTLSFENASGANAVAEVPLDAARKPGSMDYYGIVSLTMILMYSSMAAQGAVDGERSGRTISRIHVTPVTKAEILIGKMTGIMAVTLLQALVVFVFSRFVMGTDWGAEFGSVLAVVLSQIFMCVAAGTAVGYLFRSSASGVALLQGIIPISVFLGGGYVPLEQFGTNKILMGLAEFSPVRWINQTLMDIIYAGSHARLPATLAICLGSGILFLTVSAIASKREVLV